MERDFGMFDLDGKVAIVTGATGLIGRHHCIALASAGASVVAVDVDEAILREFVDELGPAHMAVVADVSDKGSLRKARDTIFNRFETIDILVNNAAINDMVERASTEVDASRFENYPIELFRSVLDVNVAGAFLCCQMFGPTMVRQGQGSIINIGSTYGVVAPNQSLYVAPDGTQMFFKSVAYPVSKGAVVMLTKYLAAYWGRSGVRVNTLSPGGVENGQPDHFVDLYSDRTPLGRMAQADDYMGALLYLASDASSYMTGHNLIVDGGFTIW